MAHENFSLSTINSKRNLLAVSAISITHAFGWVDLTELPFVGGVANGNTPISWILLALVIYLSYSTYLHVKNDSDSTTLLPSLNEIKFNKKTVYEKLQSELINFLDEIDIKFALDKIEIKHAKKLIQNIDRHIYFNHEKVSIENICDNTANVLYITVLEPISGPTIETERECEEISKQLNYEVKYYQESKGGFFANILSFREQYKELNALKLKAKSANNKLQSFEKQIPAWVTAFAIGCLLGRIFC